MKWFIFAVIRIRHCLQIVVVLLSAMMNLNAQSVGKR